MTKDILNNRCKSCVGVMHDLLVLGFPCRDVKQGICVSRPVYSYRNSITIPSEKVYVNITTPGASAR